MPGCLRMTMYYADVCENAYVSRKMPTLYCAAPGVEQKPPLSDIRHYGYFKTMPPIDVHRETHEGRLFSASL